MTGLVGNIKGNLPGTVKKFEIIDGYDWSEAIGKYFTATTERDGKRYNWAIGAGRRIYAVWAEEEAATQKELLDILRTAGYIERPEAGLLASAGRDGTSKYYLDEITEDSNHSAQKLLGEYLAAYSEMNLPLDKLAKGYKIHSLEPVALAEDSPVREIYPNAYVYRADYELYPAYKEFYSYDTFNGSDFKVTANGEQRYREKYLLFVENVYLDSNDAADAHKFYFVGFLNPAEQNITLDTDTYQKVDMWYNTEMRDLVLYALQTDYLGNAGRTARIVKALPLSQRIDTSVGTFTAEEDGRGVVLQTVKEPYGLTLNYNITAFNDAVRERCTENANILSRTIGNLGKCKMRLYYEGENGKTVATMEFTLTPGKGADLEKLLVTEAKE